jgi:hypothetical protein
MQSKASSSTANINPLSGAALSWPFLLSRNCDGAIASPLKSFPITSIWIPVFADSRLEIRPSASALHSLEKVSQPFTWRDYLVAHRLVRHFAQSCEFASTEFGSISLHHSLLGCLTGAPSAFVGHRRKFEIIVDTRIAGAIQE